MNKPDDALLHFAHALAIAAAPSSVRDEVMANFRANWKTHIEQKRARELRELAEFAAIIHDYDAKSARELDNVLMAEFDANEARAINAERG